MKLSLTLWTLVLGILCCECDNHVDKQRYLLREDAPIGRIHTEDSNLQWDSGREPVEAWMQPSKWFDNLKPSPDPPKVEAKGIGQQLNDKIRAAKEVFNSWKTRQKYRTKAPSRPSSSRSTTTTASSKTTQRTEPPLTSTAIQDISGKFDPLLVPESIHKLNCKPGAVFHACVQDCLKQRKAAQSDSNVNVNFLQECVHDCSDAFIAQPGNGCLDEAGNVVITGEGEESSKIDSAAIRWRLFWIRMRRSKTLKAFAILLTIAPVLALLLWVIKEYELYAVIFLCLNEDLDQEEVGERLIESPRTPPMSRARGILQSETCRNLRSFCRQAGQQMSALWSFVSNQCSAMANCLPENWRSYIPSWEGFPARFYSTETEMVTKGSNHITRAMSRYDVDYFALASGDATYPARARRHPSQSLEASNLEASPHRASELESERRRRLANAAERRWSLGTFSVEGV